MSTSTPTPTPTPFSTLASKPPQPPSLNTTSPTSSSTTSHSTTDTPATRTTHPSRPSAVRSPSSNNYASALASAQARSALPPGTSPLYPLSPRLPLPGANDPIPTSNTYQNPPDKTSTQETNTSPTNDGAGSEAAADEYGETPGQVVGRAELGAGFRPGVDRMQSWSEQDMKRAMQERLLSPRGGGERGGRDLGFSSRQGGGAGD
ncbi:Mucin-2 [Xylographa carneopallida]|nr:Mucin-2 [Xylographa carneopallida]